MPSTNKVTLEHPCGDTKVNFRDNAGPKEFREAWAECYTFQGHIRDSMTLRLNFVSTSPYPDGVSIDQQY
jgi:hypothetical protein